MKFNFNEVYQIESGASQKKIYRFKNKDKEGVVVDFSYNYKDFDSFLEVNKFLSNINISIPKIFDIDKMLDLFSKFKNSESSSIVVPVSSISGRIFFAISSNLLLNFLRISFLDIFLDLYYS